MTLNDAMLSALTAKGLTSGTLNDRLMDYFGKVPGPTPGALPDRELNWLLRQLAPNPLPVNTLWRQLLTGLGYTGALNDQLLQFWLAGGDGIPEVVFGTPDVASGAGLYQGLALDGGGVTDGSPVGSFQMGSQVIAAPTLGQRPTFRANAFGPGLGGVQCAKANVEYLTGGIAPFYTAATFSWFMVIRIDSYTANDGTISMHNGTGADWNVLGGFSNAQLGAQAGIDSRSNNPADWQAQVPFAAGSPVLYEVHVDATSITAYVNGTPTVGTLTTSVAMDFRFIYLGARWFDNLPGDVTWATSRLYPLLSTTERETVRTSLMAQYGLS